jgi:uncharacterized RDD family membrane protein YckC
VTPSLLTRLAVGLYEIVIIAGLMVLAGFLMVPIGLALHLPNTDLVWYTRLWMVLLVTSYFVWFWTHGGQTLPMKTWKVQLVMKDGGRVTLPIALFRWILLISGFGLVGIHLVWALIDPDRQFLHDRLVGTRLVIRTA